MNSSLLLFYFTLEICSDFLFVCLWSRFRTHISASQGLPACFSRFNRGEHGRGHTETHLVTHMKVFLKWNMFFKTLTCKNTKENKKNSSKCSWSIIYTVTFLLDLLQIMFLSKYNATFWRKGCNLLNYLFQYTACPGTFLYNNSHYFEGFLGVGHYNFWKMPSQNHVKWVLTIIFN